MMRCVGLREHVVAVRLWPRFPVLTLFALLASCAPRLAPADPPIPSSLKWSEMERVRIVVSSLDQPDDGIPYAHARLDALEKEEARRLPADWAHAAWVKDATIIMAIITSNICIQAFARDRAKWMQDGADSVADSVLATCDTAYAAVKYILVELYGTAVADAAMQRIRAGLLQIVVRMIVASREARGEPVWPAPGSCAGDCRGRPHR